VFVLLDPSTNLVMQALQSSSNPRVFSEKLVLLVNRGGKLKINVFR
jgi:hypothetical protein